MPDETMRWLVGLDLRPHGHGAIELAAWLKDKDWSGERVVLDALHVVDEGALDLHDQGPRPLVLQQAKAAAEAALIAHDVRDRFAHVDALPSVDVVDMLASAASLAHTAGLIIGRRAQTDESSVVRLGKVARRLLRRLSAPVFVVPPNLVADQIGEGAIVVAVDFDETGAALTRHALELGRVIARSIRLIHVIEMGDTIGLDYLPSTAWDQLISRRRSDREQARERWLHEHADELAPQTSVELVEGPVVETLLRAARAYDACMILCGSRRLSLAQRIWTVSTGSTLAAAAHVAVGVIPPEIEPSASASTD